MNIERAKEALKQYFGYDTFRPLQADIIQAVYDKKDTIVLMPTGGGKSLCYQIPAVTIEGTALVISPLIALMKDQVEELSASGVPAAFLNSSIDHERARNVENALLAGQVKLLYVSPEKLTSQGFQPLLKRLKISLFAIDEAHCISSWGHDFRPEYTQLRFLKEQFPGTPMMALTATADKLTRRDIVEQMGLENALQFVSSFDRPNIGLFVRPGQRRWEQIVEFLKKHPGESGIIYCLARRTCEEVAEKLHQNGFSASYYHADMPTSLRSKVQEDFKFDRLNIVCATIAFGMGINKKNVRFVIHYNMPRNLEGYYQEIGRAGRDGLPSDGLLFFSYADVMSYRDMIEQGESSPQQKDLKLMKLERMYQYAEAPVCRRKTVLNYFGEPYEKNCGHCDVCHNPPRQFDGTTATQKALSAVLRTNEAVGMQLLIDILRGSRRREIMSAGYQNIKTYGAGREYSYDDWMYLLSQMLHSGLLEIAYEKNNALRVTDLGRDILFNGKTIQLALPQPKEKPVRGKEAIKTTPAASAKSKAEVLRDELLERLIKVRRAVAQAEGIPPYNVFDDQVLLEMAKATPIVPADLNGISGIGAYKRKQFGTPFLQEIQTFLLEKVEEGVRFPKMSHLISWDLYRRNGSVEKVAAIRGFAPITIMGHLLYMYENGESIDIGNWVSPEAVDAIQGALPLFQTPYVLEDLREHFQGRYNWDEIKWAIADARRKEQQL
jgi:ATP-dependent DNA helicase RecQ